MSKDFRGADVIGHEATETSKTMQNNGHYAVEGHLRSQLWYQW